ncbi:MAG TPA: S-adenosylmethionine synthetase N-terminal domain-containing protein [Patescibacteria group bacterium]|nr:S-adenosylmethionine synthetase N-terminal domain-containing protein [Patescibacteria group bacterium]
MSLARVRGPGEPDMISDLVAAAIVEEYARRDPAARLNIRVSGGHGALFVVGEVLSTADFDVSAIVRKTLLTNGIHAPIEPFIALERMSPNWAPERGSRELVSGFGYATNESQDFLPRAASLARDAARELERRRTSDPDWFWLGSDYTVYAEDGKNTTISIRAEHVDQESVTDVRKKLTELLQARYPGALISINEAGAETGAGLETRIGSSGLHFASDQFGSRLPTNSSASGRHLSHPANAGTALIRALARELVLEGKGNAVMIHAYWRPLETKPSFLSARNETGKNLGTLIDLTRLDLANIPETYLEPGLAVARLRAAFDGSVELPWEK